MAVTFLHSGQMSPDELARLATGPAETLERIRDGFRPRLNTGDELRGRVTRVEGRIAGLEREIRGHETTIREHEGRTTTEARTAVREARVAIQAARAKIAEERRDLPGLRAAYDRHMTAMERDIDAEVERRLPNVRSTISEVRAEALRDQQDARDLPTRDVDRAYGDPGSIRRFLNEWNPLDWGGSLDLENDRRMVRSSEAERSITLYQRLRTNYESLRPRARDRFPSEPFVGGDE